MNSGAFVMEWRSCVGFDQYEVSECGDVRRNIDSRTRINGWRLRGFIDCDGYLRYILKSPNGKSVSKSAHQLVAEAFIGRAPTPEHEVAHNTGSRVASHFAHLRWATRADNHADMKIHGTGLAGERNPKAKITEKDVISIRREYREIKNSGGARRNSGGARRVTELDDKYGLNRATIVNIARGRSWKHVPADVSHG